MSPVIFPGTIRSRQDFSHSTAEIDPHDMLFSQLENQKHRGVAGGDDVAPGDLRATDFGSHGGGVDTSRFTCRRSEHRGNENGSGRV